MDFNIYPYLDEFLIPYLDRYMFVILALVLNSQLIENVYFDLNLLSLLIK